MSVSMDQVRREAFRALDAEGAPAGVDEDCAVCIAWLEAVGLNGLRILADALDLSVREERCLGLDTGTSGILDAGGRSAVFCAPIALDRLLDLADRGGDASLELLNIRHPSLLLASAVRADLDGTHINITWQASDGARFKALACAQSARIEGRGSDLPDWCDAEILECVTAACVRGPAPETAAPWRELIGSAEFRDRLERAYRSGIDADAATFARVSRYAAGILVPESEQSRVLGAGAGLTDND